MGKTVHNVGGLACILLNLWSRNVASRAIFLEKKEQLRARDAVLVKINPSNLCATAGRKLTNSELANKYSTNLGGRGHGPQRAKIQCFLSGHFL